jgi:putative ABC transport system substrate-binding protein
MRRREFLTLVGGAAAWPLAAHGQQRRPTIGFLGSGTPVSQGQWAAAFVKRLDALGWIDGRTVNIDVRWAEGRSERANELAIEFARRKVDVIVTAGTAVTSSMNATTEIPIVFALAVDPVGSGFVKSLSRPGGNVTGLSVQGPDVAGKRLELLQEAIPGVRRIAAIVNAGYPASVNELAEVKAACRALGLDLAATLEIRKPEDIGPVLRTLQGRADALYVVSDALTNANREQINTFAAAARLPTISAIREFAQAQGFMSYGPSYQELFRRSADYVDKILRGAKPADLPVEQPTKFELVINLKTAKAIGLTIPPALLARADEVIE